MTRDGDPKPAPPAQINLNDLLPPGQFDISIKPAESEADARVPQARDCYVRRGGCDDQRGLLDVPGYLVIGQTFRR
jgi:hypothetical protein